MNLPKSIQEILKKTNIFNKNIKEKNFMEKFSIYKLFEGNFEFEAENVIYALRYAMNLEADLYYNGHLIYSCLGLDQESNLKLLKKYAGVIKDKLTGNLKFEDKSKNKGFDRIFANFYFYLWKGEKCINVQIRNYYINEGEVKVFYTLSEVIEEVKKVNKFYKADEDKIHINDYSGKIANDIVSFTLKLYNKYSILDNKKITWKEDVGVYSYYYIYINSFDKITLKKEFKMDVSNFKNVAYLKIEWEKNSYENVAKTIQLVVLSKTTEEEIVLSEALFCDKDLKQISSLIDIE